MKLKKTILYIFILIYILSMTGLTAFGIHYKRESFQSEIDKSLRNMNTGLLSVLHLFVPQDVSYENKLEMVQRIVYQNSIMNDPDINLSVAAYDPDGKRIARSVPYLGKHSYQNMQETILMYSLYDYLSPALLDQFEHYCMENEKVSKDARPLPYAFYGRTLKDDPNALVQIDIAKHIYVKSGEGKELLEPHTNSTYGFSATAIDENGKETPAHYILSDEEIVFSYTSPILSEKNEKLSEWMEMHVYGLNESGREHYWEANLKESYLPLLKDTLENIPYDVYINFMTEDLAEVQKVSGISLPVQKKDQGFSMNLLEFSSEPDYTDIEEYKTSCGLLLACYTTHPIRAALRMLLLPYLFGGLFMLLCLLFIYRILGQTEKQRRTLEEERINYTNAVAHELKTPLGISRALTENLQEKVSPEKEGYYLSQMTKQIDHMDSLVMDMIDASKLDSDQFVLQREVIDLSHMINKDLAFLKALIVQKNLTLTTDLSPSSVIGDPKYLEKAVSNLLTNAIVHNRENGQISIKLNENHLRIQNTVCEGDSSSTIKNTGIGLYLTKKILKKHKMDLTSTEQNDLHTVVIRLK